MPSPTLYRQAIRSDVAIWYTVDATLGGVPVATGRFGADMQVALVNDGPVTIPLRIEPAGSSQKQ